MDANTSGTSLHNGTGLNFVAHAVSAFSGVQPTWLGISGIADPVRIALR